jgi:hypothetical protein
MPAFRPDIGATFAFACLEPLGGNETIRPRAIDQSLALARVRTFDQNLSIEREPNQIWRSSFVAASPQTAGEICNLSIKGLCRLTSGSHGSSLHTYLHLIYI